MTRREEGLLVYEDNARLLLLKRVVDVPPGRELLMLH